MADEKSKLQTKLSPLIEGQVPDFIQADHPIFVDFLKQYYKFMEAGQVTDEVVNSYVRYETTTTAYVLDEKDGDRILTEETVQFTNGETITVNEIYELNKDQKRNICDTLCNNGTTADFNNFIPLLDMIEESLLPELEDA